MKNANHMKTIDPRLSSSPYTLDAKKDAVDDGGVQVMLILLTT